MVPLQVEKGALSSGSVTVEVILRNDTKDITLLEVGRGAFEFPKAVILRLDPSQRSRPIYPPGLSPPQARKIRTEEGAEGELVCPEAGQCVLSFVNGSSLWSRTVRYSFGEVPGS